MKKITITEQDKLFFTSDTHFFHANIIGYANRPYDSVEQMNEALIRNWNEIVPEDGIVFHLGDFSYGGSKEWWSVLPKLNGQIHLVLGNHDMDHIGEPYMDQFASVNQQLTLSVEGQVIILNHNPFLCFGGAYKDVWQLFGHVHSGPNSIGNGKDDSRLKYLLPTQYDVGVDNNNYKPVPYSVVEEKIKRQIAKANK